MSVLSRPMKKLAIVTSHPIQYQAPLFRAIAQQPDIELTVYFGCDYGINPTKVHPGFDKGFAWDIPLLDGYKYVFLKNSKENVEVTDWRLDGPELKSYFKSGGYNAVLVFGWSMRLYWQAIRWAKRYNIPLILRAESNLKHAQAWYIKGAKRILFPWLFKQFKAFLSIGSYNSELYRHFGVPEAAIFSAPYCVDNEFFSEGAAAQALKAKQLRRKLGILESDMVFLFMAKFIDRKRPLDLIGAAARNRSCRGSHVILVGGGELMEACQSAITENELTNVHLVGFVNQSELPTYYAAADVFVLPSKYETWGLVLNEAMACALPGIVSNGCGAAEDMVIEGKTGFSYPVGDVRRLAELMMFMANNKEICRQMGQHAAEHIHKFSVTSAVSALNKSLQYIDVQ